MPRAVPPLYIEAKTLSTAARAVCRRFLPHTPPCGASPPRGVGPVLYGVLAGCWRKGKRKCNYKGLAELGMDEDETRRMEERMTHLLPELEGRA
jgi:hypothetical protein